MKSIVAYLSVALIGLLWAGPESVWAGRDHGDRYERHSRYGDRFGGRHDGWQSGRRYHGGRHDGYRGPYFNRFHPAPRYGFEFRHLPPRLYFGKPFTKPYGHDFRDRHRDGYRHRFDRYDRHRFGRYDRHRFGRYDRHPFDRYDRGDSRLYFRFGVDRLR